MFLHRLIRPLALLLVLFPSPDRSQTVVECRPGETSLQEVLDRCRETEGATTLYLREGTYRLSEPLRITPDHAGKGHPLTIRSYPGERATLSGNVLLHPAWEPFRDGIYRARIGDVPGMDRLFGDGRLLILARFPNYDPDAVRFNGTSSDATSPDRVRSWARPEGGFLHVMHIEDWGDFHYRITGKDPSGQLVLEGGWQNNRPLGLHPDNRMVEGIFEELDAPGEWFYDRSSGTLYYYPLPGEDIRRMRFEAAQAQCLVSVQGKRDRPVRGLTLSDLAFTGTARTFMEEYEPLLRSDWTIHRGAALFFEGSEDCTIDGCELTDLGGNAVFFSRWNRRDTLRASLLTRIGASAVCFVGDPADVRSPSFRYEDFVVWDEMDFERGTKGDNYPRECVVEDNLIHNIGLVEKQVAGVEISMSYRIRVSHNSIYDTPRAGINVSEGTFGGHVIEYNDVFDTVRETGDHGSFNSWGRDRWWHPDYAVMAAHARIRPDLILADRLAADTLRHNRFRCDRGWDIDLDDGSTWYVIEDNLCLSGGIKLREGFFREVRGNIVLGNSLHAHAWFENSGDVVCGNYFSTPYQPWSEHLQGECVDYNLFADSLSLIKARELGLDAHSGVAQGPPGIPQDGFGVQSPRLRAIARTPEIPALPSETGGVAAAEAEDSGFLYWLQRSYSSEMYQQDSVMLVDEKGDAMLIRKLDTVLIKLSSALFHRDLPQAVSGRERQLSDPDFRIGRDYSLDNGLLLRQFAEVIRNNHPAITPKLGREHSWSPAAEQYLLYGYWHRLWRRLRGLQRDFPIPMLMRSKLLVCLACGWTSRYCITGTEQALTGRILSYPDRGVGIPELFAESYVLNRGNLYMTLLACENVLAGQPHRAGRDDDPLQRKLAYIRDDSKELGDNYGAWYHFFGIALYGMLRPEMVSVFVADTESVGSFFMEGPDRQETLINHYGALFGHELRKMIRKGSWSDF